MTKKAKTIIIAFVVIIIIASIGYGNNRVSDTGEMPLHPEEKISEITKNVVLKTATPNETDGWKTYRNEEYGFEVKYPQERQLEFPVNDN